MATISQALALAIEHHQAGRLQLAEQIYRNILAVQPDHADALHLLGVIAQQVGQHALAIDYLARAITLNPRAAPFHSNLGEAYLASGRISEAIACYRRAIELNPSYAAARNNLGNVLRSQGKLDEAIACFRRALMVNPEFAEAYNNLGNALQSAGKPDEAVACCRRALELSPAYPEAHATLGNALRDLGQSEEAVVCYRRAIELRPGYAELYNNLANALQDQGKMDEAVACYRRALELKPDHAELQNNLGNALREQGKLDAAVACHRRAIELKPSYSGAHNSLGIALQRQNKLDEAVACHRRALDLKPDFVEAHNNLGIALKDQGKLAEAIACIRRALELKPDYAEAHSNLGLVLQRQGKLGEAAAACRRALELKPDYADAHNNLGNVLKEQGELDRAAACYLRALELKPDLAEAHTNLGSALKDQGELDEAIGCYRWALELRPSYVEAHANLLLALQYRPGVTPAELAAEHAEYQRQHAAPLRAAWKAHENVRDPERLLRVGFVSPDLRRHPVGYFLVRALENLDPRQCETFCYYDHSAQDDLTMRLRAAAKNWRDVVGLGHEQLAALIRADRIDVLFDLAGHAGSTRLLVFARKPAPIQITWIGYEGTTGLEAMDYLLADRYVAPEAAQSHFREKVLRMPQGYLCYDPPAAAPPVGPLPATGAGQVTFGSFNNPAKTNPQVIRLWARILCRLPQSRLVLKYRGLGDAAVRQRYLDLFAAAGVEPQRLEFLPATPFLDYLNAYHHLDIALDPFPFSGSATTCEALWMGVPVITCPGETFASRHSFSHLSNIGLTETIARDPDDYVEIAVSLAGDLPRLAALRAGLRERMAASPLCDGKRFADDLMSLLRDVWRQWVEP